MFTVLFSEYTALESKMRERADSFQKWITNKENRIYKKHFPKHKQINWKKLYLIPEIMEMRKTVEERKTFRRFWDHWHNKIDKLKKELFEVAQNENVIPGDTFNLFDRISSTNWSSQGFGEIKYAENFVKSKTDIFEACGIEYKVDREKTDYGSVNFFIYVKTDQIGIEILKRKYLPLVEEVRLAWKRGTNPRVDKYWLPHNYESDCGIDYFGNIVDETKYKKALHEK